MSKVAVMITTGCPTGSTVAYTREFRVEVEEDFVCEFVEHLSLLIPLVVEMHFDGDDDE